MFQTKEFRRSLELRANQALQEHRLESFDERIIDVLQFLASAHEEHLLLTESKRPLLQQRGKKDALASANTIFSTAARIARKAGRKRVYMNDLIESYKIHFCQIWPFCR